MDKLIEKIIKTNNPTVAGLDPKLEFVPNFIKEKHFANTSDKLQAAADSILEFNKGLIDSFCDLVPAIKPQCAYYEMYGWQGVRALTETIAYAKEKGLYIITDGKRNDIGATMQAYATAHIGATDINGELIPTFNGDSLTVNGYLGSDGIDPLIELCKKYDKTIFVLAKTSNKSSGELQDRLIGDKKVYEVMGEMCEQWGADTIGKHNFSCVGAVVGATYPEQLKELREKMKHTLFLVPGYGAQGGGAKDVSYAFNKDGVGAIINSSRGIMCAYQNDNYTPEQYQEASRNEVIRMRDDINQFR